MGTQGLCIRAMSSGRATHRGQQARVTLLMSCLAIVSALAGCSSSSNPYPTASAPPPPNASAAAAGQPVYPPPPGPVATAPPPSAPPQDQGSSVISLRSSYVGFLDKFRDPPSQESPAPGSTAPTQAANVPHPPNTYTPPNQPYAPPAGQQAYGGAPRYAAGATPVVAAAPADADLAANAYPYPKQTLFDSFRGSTQSAQPSVPHPPSTYTPVNQPYSPPSGQQPASGAPAGAAPAAAAPAPDADSSGYPYPKQSLFDVFSNKAAGQ